MARPTSAVTGHRALPAGAARHIEAALRGLADHPGATWLTGVVGTDRVAAHVLVARGERVELVLPFAPAIQAARWHGRAQATFRDHLERAAAVHVIHPRYGANDYRATGGSSSARIWCSRPGTVSAVPEQR